MARTGGELSRVEVGAERGLPRDDQTSNYAESSEFRVHFDFGPSAFGGWPPLGTSMTAPTAGALPGPGSFWPRGPRSLASGATEARLRSLGWGAAEPPQPRGQGWWPKLPHGAADVPGRTLPQQPGAWGSWGLLPEGADPKKASASSGGSLKRTRVASQAWGALQPQVQGQSARWTVELPAQPRWIDERALRRSVVQIDEHEEEGDSGED
jgi:hypothetical protein